MIRAAASITDASAINIGTAEHVKIRETAELIFDITGWRPKSFFFDTTKPVGVFSRAASLDRIREKLNWEPQVLVREGLERTIEWYYRTHDKLKTEQTLALALTER